MFVIYKDKPYFYRDGKCYPCEVSATSVKVDFATGNVSKVKFTSFYTEDEVRHKLNIQLIDGWDEKKNKVVKVSNKIVSSIKKGN